MENPSEETLHEQRRTLWIAYLLYLLLFTAPIGFVISLINTRKFKKLTESEVAALPEVLTTLRTHHEWLVRTFIAAVVVGMMGFGSLYYGIGYVLWGGVGLWWIYRIARGIVSLIGTRPMPVWI
ncbi:MAG: chaperone protein dnaJ [Gammaproteobacteria bacterium]|nr:MAG: chaperone protein dnaJ [Gammaproteobacteria bacterium]TND06635.1 MAG: chaperone protein dnaJ [Gammaproteobacteria bacterium]